MPAVTVVIPAYNSARYIGEALESVRAQSMHDFEVIVVDDGSTDRTVEVARDAARGLAVQVLEQRNSGPGAARNAGIRAAAGRYCAFLDADDLMLPDRLAEQTRLLDADAQLGLVHTDLMTFDERGTIHGSRRAFSDPCGGQILDRLLLGNFITTSTVMAPRAVLLKAGLFGLERRVSEDFELWLRIAAEWPVGYIERALIRYRYTPGSLSGDKLFAARAALDVVDSFWRDHRQYRGQRPDVYRRSRARHLATAGAAALNRGSRGLALRYIAAALGHDPWDRRSWKWALKALLPLPSSRPAAA